MRKFISTAATTLSLTMVSLVYGAPVLAQAGEEIDLGPPADWEGKLPKGIDLPAFISGVIQLLLIAGAVFFFIYLLIGGIKWIMSGGDKGEIEKARGQITHALIGLLIVLGVWVIHSILKSLFGIDILKLKIPSFGVVTPTP